MKADLIVQRYVLLRDKKSQLKKAYEASVEDINAALERLEGAIKKQLDEMGAESIRTEHGTAFKKTSTSATVADWDSLLPFIQENQRWDMLEKRVAKTAVDQYVEEFEDLPPGVNYRQVTTIQVNRPN